MAEVACETQVRMGGNDARQPISWCNDYAMKRSSEIPAAAGDPGAVQRWAWARNVLPPVERVAPGLWSIPVPIPDNPLRYVLVYAFEHPGGIAIVDAGWDTESAWRALTDGLATAGGSITDVTAVLVTHIHPDHYGLAGRVREASGAWIGLHPADAALIDERYLEIDDLMARMLVLLADCGVPEAESADIASSSVPIRSWVQTVAPDRLIEDGERIGLPGWDLRAVWTPGHSPGHLCFVEPDRRLLLTGDCVLPRITPNVSLHAQSDPNPLADFLDSLDRLGRFTPELVLPAHEYRFTGLHDRLTALTGHHRDRLDEIEAAVAARPGVTCWEVTGALSWSRPWGDISGYMRRAANGETLAHLELLARRGRVRRRPGPPTRWFPGPDPVGAPGRAVSREPGGSPGCC